MAEAVAVPSIREFLRVVWSDWGSRVSGIASVPFTILALFAKADYARVIWGTLALVALFATVYQVWGKERKAFLQEVAKNNHPLLTGAFVEGHFRAALMASSLASEDNETEITADNVQDTHMTFKVRVVNERPVSTNITDARLTVNIEDGRIFQVRPMPIPPQASLKTDAPAVSNSRTIILHNYEYPLEDLRTVGQLERGRAAYGWLRFYMSGVSRKRVEETASFALEVQDGFGSWHLA